jgi:hypothetical protein
VLNDITARHGTRRSYNDGCRCDDCRDAQRLYQQRYREQALSPITKVTPARAVPGPVEAGVQAEIGGIATQARQGLAAMALSLAQLMDDPRAVNQKSAAAKVLTSLLEKLHEVGARGRHGHLAAVRTMTRRGAIEKGRPYDSVRGSVDS